jgi:4-hydroxybenzoate polyprenyltransferase
MNLLNSRPAACVAFSAFSCHRRTLHLLSTSVRLKVSPALPSRSKATSQLAVSSKTWVDRLPPTVRPYLYLTRIDKPIGTLLLYYPCGTFLYRPRLALPYDFLAWSICMASYSLETPWSTPLSYLGIFGAGALVMRGAGCTINDLWDKDLDKSVGEESSGNYLFQCTYFVVHSTHKREATG